MKDPHRFHKSFTDVPITDAGVDTVEFLEAAEGLTGIFSMSFTHTLINQFSQERLFRFAWIDSIFHGAERSEG
jgi:hypothetical protein